jgi:hypothetical protein
MPSDAFLLSDSMGLSLINTLSEKHVILLQLEDSSRGVFMEKGKQLGQFTVLANDQ